MTETTNTVEQQLQTLMAEAEAAVAATADAAAVEDIRVRYLGKKGLLTEQLKSLGGLPPEARPRVGALVNQAKDALQEKIGARKQQLESAARNRQLSREVLDVTLPGRGVRQGGPHPITRTLERLENLFTRMGFEIADGPEIEDDYHNFEALNIPPSHPSRAMHDTFYFDICFAISTASSGVLASLTPPPLPRPPAWICALTTTRPPSSLAISRTASGLSVTTPRGTATPYLLRISFA